MIDAEGTVTALDREFAIVRMDEGGCGRCQEEGGCGGNNLGRMLCSTQQTFRVLNPGNAAVGQRVRVSVPEGAVRQSAVYAYGLPLIALFIGAIGGSSLAGEVGAIVGALTGLFATWFFLWLSQGRQIRNKRFHPYIRT
jgi:sigma-E factor negative regulatory protein RseC